MKPLLRNGACWPDWDGSFQPADWEKRVDFIFLDVQDKLGEKWHVLWKPQQVADLRVFCSAEWLKTKYEIISWNQWRTADGPDSRAGPKTKAGLE